MDQICRSACTFPPDNTVWCSRGSTVGLHGDCCVSGSGAWTHGETLVVGSARPAGHFMCSGNHHAQWNYFLLLCSAGRAWRQKAVLTATDDVVDIWKPFTTLLTENFTHIFGLVCLVSTDCNTFTLFYFLLKIEKEAHFPRHLCKYDSWFVNSMSIYAPKHPKYRHYTSAVR